MTCGLIRVPGQIWSAPVKLLGVGFAVALATGAGPARADQAEPEVPGLPAAVRAAARPSGEVREVQVQDSGLQIAGPTRFVTAERAVPAPTTPSEPRTVDLQGLEETFGQRLINERMADLRRCRGEVAIAQHVAVQAVRAREVLIRWAVAFDGSVEDAAVVATAPADPDVLGCVHRKISAWQFRAPGDRLLVKTPLIFEASRGSAGPAPVPGTTARDTTPPR